MKSLAPALLATLALTGCKPEPPAAQADSPSGQASTGAAGAVTGVRDPNPTGAGATAGAATSDTTADLKSTSPVAANPPATRPPPPPAPTYSNRPTPAPTADEVNRK